MALEILWYLSLIHICGLKVAIDLASFNIVAENLEFLRGLVSEHVDIVFANEDEAKTFTCEAEPLNALQAISQMCELAVVKIGTKGALIKQGEEVVHVGIMAAAKRVDTTGAGDFYAAGFLAGLCDGLSLRQCGTDVYKRQHQGTAELRVRAPRTAQLQRLRPFDVEL